MVAGSGRLNREEAEFFKITVGDLEADDACYRPPPEPRAVSGVALLAPGPFDLADQGLLASKQPLPNAAMIGTCTCAGFIVVERSIPALSRRTQAAPLKSVRQRGIRGSGGRIRGDGGGWCSRLRLLRFGRHRCNQCDGVESNQGAHGTRPFMRRA